MTLNRTLWYVVVAIVAIWLIDEVVWHGGEIINLLLIVAVVIIAYNLFTGRRKI